MTDQEHAMAEMQAMMQQAHLVDVVQVATHAYDTFATCALQVLLKKTEIPMFNTLTIDAIAHTAWQIADAMMEERKKRGLGGFNDNKEE